MLATSSIPHPIYPNQIHSSRWWCGLYHRIYGSFNQKLNYVDGQILRHFINISKQEMNLIIHTNILQLVCMHQSIFDVIHLNKIQAYKKMINVRKEGLGKELHRVQNQNKPCNSIQLHNPGQQKQVHFPV